LVIDFFGEKPDGASSKGRDLKQSHSTRTKRKAIANIQQSCSDSPAIVNQMDGVFGTDRHGMTAAPPFGAANRTAF